jgi:hypothetical protein
MENEKSTAQLADADTRKVCVYCSELIAAGALVCKRCNNSQAPRWFARLHTHWLTQSISAAALVGIGVWLYQTWSGNDVDRRQRMQRLAQSAEVLQATTEQLRQPCVAAKSECQKRFIDESANLSVNVYNFSQEARYFINTGDPVRNAVSFVDDFFNPSKQKSGHLGDFQYSPVQIALTRARDALTTPFDDASWCTAERRAAIQELSVSLDVYRYCEMAIRAYAWEEATGSIFHKAHNRTKEEYKVCTQPADPGASSGTVWRANKIGALVANMDNFDHSAPWLFDSYCAESGLALGGGVIPPRTRQLLVVTSASWTDTTGTLVRYERQDASLPWKREGAPAKVVLGSKGMGWGQGLLPLPAREDSQAPFKEEGDGRSPAGLFPLRTVFAEQPVTAAHLPVRITTDDLYCDDRVESPTYNQPILQTAADRLNCSTSGSACPTEKLKRADELYRRFIWVSYNSSPVVKSAGSCIFLHLNHPDLSPTAGCTTVSPDYMQELLAWLEPEDYPLLLQLPEKELARVNLPLEKGSE